MPHTSTNSLHYYLTPFVPLLYSTHSNCEKECIWLIELIKPWERPQMGLCIGSFQSSTLMRMQKGGEQRRMEWVGLTLSARS